MVLSEETGNLGMKTNKTFCFLIAPCLVSAPLGFIPTNMAFSALRKIVFLTECCILSLFHFCLMLLNETVTI